jgi:hypothetical protein
MRNLLTLLIITAALTFTACKSGTDQAENNNTQTEQDSMNNSVLDKANDYLKDTTPVKTDSAIDSNQSKTY